MSKELIDPIRRRIDNAWLESDADGITNGLADDAILLPPNSPPLMGRQQINNWLEELFRHYTMTELSMPERELTIKDQANWLGIWRQGAGGSWAEVCGIWNSALPLPGVHSTAAEETAAAG